jgi:hypothetical protein
MLESQLRAGRPQSWGREVAAEVKAMEMAGWECLRRTSWHELTSVLTIELKTTLRRARLIGTVQGFGKIVSGVNIPVRDVVLSLDIRSTR